MEKKYKEIIKNACFGGFSLSDAAYQWLIDNKGWKVIVYDSELEEQHKRKTGLYNLHQNEEGKNYIFSWNLKKEYSILGKYSYCGSTSTVDFRSNPDVIEVVKTLKKKSWGSCAELEIVKVPVGIEVEIDEYDGLESIDEVHQSW